MEKYRVYAGIDLDAVRYNMESMHKNINNSISWCISVG